MSHVRTFGRAAVMAAAIVASTLALAGPPGGLRYVDDDAPPGGDGLTWETAYTYLQEWLPQVAQAVVREQGADFIGLGRMMLSYPELPRDVLRGDPLQRALVCRTFSDCTTAPRNGLVSGCYPIDPFYKRRPEAEALLKLKRSARQPRT